MNVCLRLETLPPFLYQLNPTAWNSLAFSIIAAFLLLLKNPSAAAGIGLLKRGIECVPIASVARRLELILAVKQIMWFLMQMRIFK